MLHLGKGSGYAVNHYHQSFLRCLYVIRVICPHKDVTYFPGYIYLSAHEGYMYINFSCTHPCGAHFAHPTKLGVARLLCRLNYCTLEKGLGTDVCHCHVNREGGWLICLSAVVLK